MLRRASARLLQLQLQRPPQQHSLPQNAAAIIVRDINSGYKIYYAKKGCKIPPIPECNMIPVGCHSRERKPKGRRCPKKTCHPCPPPPCDEGGGGGRRFLLGALALLSGLGALYYFGKLDNLLDWLGLGWLKRVAPGTWATFPGLGNPRKRKARHRHPPNADELPPSVSYLVVGGGSAGLAAARAIHSLDKKAQILIVSSENAYPYQRSPLSKELWQAGAGACFLAGDGKMHSVFYEPEDFYVDCKALADGGHGVALARGWEVQRLSLRDHKAYLHDGSPIEYERCLLATGCTPFDLAVFERARPEIKKKVQCLHDVCDFETLRAALRAGARDIVVVGGTPLACELSASLARFGHGLDVPGMRVNLVFPEETPNAQVLPVYLGRWLSRRLQAEGVRVVPKAVVRSTAIADDHAVLRLSNGESLPACRVIVAAANAPNTDLAGPSGIRVDRKNGGFRVNDELRADRDVWAAGDCASFCDPRVGRTRAVGMDHAIMSGSIAGHNMAATTKTDEGNEIPQEKYDYLPMHWGSMCPGASYEAVGLVDTALPTVGVFSPVNKCTCSSNNNENPENADYSHGVVFYLRDNIVVGVLLWNLHHRLDVARQIVDSEVHYDDLDDAVQQLCIHAA